MALTAFVALLALTAVALLAGFDSLRSRVANQSTALHRMFQALEVLIVVATIFIWVQFIVDLWAVARLVPRR